MPALASSSRPLSKYGSVNFTVDATTESPCFNSIPPCRLHFQRRPSINFILPTPLPTVITLRSPTPLTSVNFFLLFFFSSSSLEHHAALTAFPVDDMVTFTAAMLQTRQTAVVLHLISNFLHLLRLLACFLDCFLAASPRPCRLPVPISLRPFTTFMRFPMTSPIWNAGACFFTSRPLSKYGREFHSRRHNRVSVLQLHSTLPTSFPTTAVN
jgi:hypothetical protein